MTTASLKRLLQFGLSLGLLAMVFLIVDLRATFAELRHASVAWVVVGLAFTVLSRVLMAYKWNLLLRAKGHVVSHLEVIRLYYVSSFLGLLLPSTVGSDVARAMLLRDDDRTMSEVVSSIIVERLLGLVMLALAALPTGVILVGMTVDSAVPGWVVIGVPGALLLGSLAAILLSLTDRAHRLASGLTARLESGRLKVAGQQLQRLFDSYRDYRDHRGTLAVFCLLTGLEIATVAGWYYAAARSVGVDVPILQFALVVPVITVLVRLPISLAGLGVMQGAFVFFLGLLGVPPEQGLATGLVAQALATVAVLPGGAMYGLLPRYRRRTELA
ncbi:MAG: flippase-like domain-containing protein [Gemmatimonadota bacterium]|nr:flippase-like domain-containing protein [Gemmatimonadota bacterium]